jgi:hypothetical protein
MILIYIVVKTTAVRCPLPRNERSQWTDQRNINGKKALPNPTDVGHRGRPCYTILAASFTPFQTTPANYNPLYQGLHGRHMWHELVTVQNVQQDSTIYPLYLLIQLSSPLYQKPDFEVCGYTDDAETGLGKQFKVRFEEWCKKEMGEYVANDSKVDIERVEVPKVLDEILGSG